MEQVTQYPVCFTNDFKDEVAKDLVLKCLTKDYDRRLDIDEFMVIFYYTKLVIVSSR
jgi:hypothetical protein